MKLTEGTRPASPGARFGLMMLTVVYAFNFVDRQILVILQEQIKADMGLSDTQLGLLSGFSFALVYITAGIPIAYWADRTNRRNIISISLAVWSGMTAVSGLAQNYTHLLLARIGVGIGEAGGSPPAHAMISDYYPPERRGTALAIYSTGVQIGVLLGFLVGGFVSQMFGWRIAFMAVGLPGILFAGVFYLTVKEPQRGVWEQSHNVAHKPGLAETLRLLSRFKSFWYIAGGMGLASFTGFGNGNFAPSFLIRSHGFSVAEVGVVLAFFSAGGGFCGTFLGGVVADRLGQRDQRWYLWVPGIAGIASIPFALPYLLAESTVVTIAFLFLVSMSISTYLGPCLAICHGLVPASMRALTSAILFFIMNLIGLGMGPLTAGLLSDYFTGIYGADGLRYAMLVVSFIGVPSIFFFFLAARALPGDMERGVQQVQA